MYYFKRVKEMKSLSPQFLIMVILWCKILGSTFIALDVEYFGKFIAKKRQRTKPHIGYLT